MPIANSFSLYLDIEGRITEGQEACNCLDNIIARNKGSFESPGNFRSFEPWSVNPA